MVRSEYSALGRLVMNQDKFNRLKIALLTGVKGKVEELKELIVKMFRDHCGNRLFILYFHPGRLGTFECIEMLDRTSFKRYNVHVNQIYRHTLQCLFSGMAEMVDVMNQEINDSVTTSNVQMSTKDNRKRSI